MTARTIVLSFGTVLFLAAGAWAQDQSQVGPSLETRVTALERRVDNVYRDIEYIDQHLGIGRPRETVSTLPRRNLEPSRPLIDRIAQLEQALASPPTGAGLPAGQGRLVLTNQTGSTQTVTVNSARIIVTAGRTDVWVPLGDVEVFLTYFEPHKVMDRSQWRWTGRDFEMLVNVRP